MSEIDDRIERGVAIFRRAGDDPELLGAALLAFHSALERSLDAQLEASPALSDADRQLLEAGRLGWLARASAAEQAGILSRTQRDEVLQAARERQAIARGDACAWSAGELQSYGQLAARVSGRMELLRQIDQRAERARTTAAYAAPPAWREPPAEQRRFPIVQAIVTLVFLATLAAAGWLIFQQLDGARILRALGAGSAPTSAPVADLPTLTPAPPARSARVSGLGGGPGWLHVTPSFDSPTRAIPLADGMEVALRDQQETGSDGTRWQLVEAGGYEGWCPENNLTIATSSP